MYLTANLFREDLGKSKGREVQLAMENAKLREERDAEREVKARLVAEFEAFKRLVAARKDAADTPAEVDESSKGAGAGSSQATDAPKGPVAMEDFFVVGVVPWRQFTTLAAAWRLWVQPSYIMGGMSLRDVCAEFGQDRNKNNSFFIDKSSEAATATAVKRLDDVLLLCNFTEFTNGLAVLHDTPPNKRQKTGCSTEKRTVNDLAQRKVSWLIVKLGLCDEDWGTALFGDEWEVIKKEEMAKEKAEEEKKRASEARKAEQGKAMAGAAEK
ncbi:unnamed protein product [Closterium sp. Yama58-4]|nr:unnamed protein product [Closterium sp. Yama58-4]